MMRCIERNHSASDKSGKGKACGFTLIEILFVIAIIGMLTATAALRFGGLTQKAGMEWTLGRFESLENSLRQDATLHHRQVKLSLELGTGHVIRTQGIGKKDSMSLDFGSHMVIDRYVSAKRDTSTGQVQIDYSPEGTSHTFAVSLKSRTNARPLVWLLFAGTTGQVTRWENEEDVLQILHKTGSKGTDSR